MDRKIGRWDGFVWETLEVTKELSGQYVTGWLSERIESNEEACNHNEAPETGKSVEVVKGNARADWVRRRVRKGETRVEDERRGYRSAGEKETGEGGSGGLEGLRLVIFSHVEALMIIKELDNG